MALTSQMPELQQEYARLKSKRAQMQAVKLDLTLLQKEADEVAVMQARLTVLRQQAQALHAETALLDTARHASANKEQRKHHVAHDDRSTKENIHVEQQGSTTKPSRPYDITNTCSSMQEFVKGVVAPSKATSNPSLPTKPIPTRNKHQASTNSRSPNGSKIPQHPHQLQQQQRSSSSSGNSPSYSGDVGPNFIRSPNPVFVAQPQHTTSTSSCISNASSGVVSFSTVRNPCYGDARENCPPTPAFYTPAAFTPGPTPKLPAFTPGPEAAAFAAMLEAGLPTSQLMGASKTDAAQHQPQGSASNFHIATPLH